MVSGVELSKGLVQDDTSFLSGSYVPVPLTTMLYIMYEQGLYGDTNATAMTIALEGDKEHSVRAQLRTKPSDKEITSKVESILKY